MHVIQSSLSDSLCSTSGFAGIFHSHAATLEYSVTLKNGKPGNTDK